MGLLAVAPVTPAVWPSPNSNGESVVEGAEAKDDDATMATDDAQDTMRKAPFDEEHFKSVMAVVRIGKAKGAGKSEAEQAANRGKTAEAAA